MLWCVLGICLWWLVLQPKDPKAEAALGTQGGPAIQAPGAQPKNLAREDQKEEKRDHIAAKPNGVPKAPDSIPATEPIARKTVEPQQQPKERRESAAGQTHLIFLSAHSRPRSCHPVGRKTPTATADLVSRPSTTGDSSALRGVSPGDPAPNLVHNPLNQHAELAPYKAHVLAVNGQALNKIRPPAQPLPATLPTTSTNGARPPQQIPLQQSSPPYPAPTNQTAADPSNGPGEMVSGWILARSTDS